MRPSNHPAIVALGLLLSLNLSSCASQTQRARTTVAIGALTMAAGLLVAGDCTPGSADRSQPSGSCAGTPDAADAARGSALFAAGASVMAAGMAMQPRDEPRAAVQPRDEPRALNTEGALTELDQGDGKASAAECPTSAEHQPAKDCAAMNGTATAVCPASCGQ